MFGLAGRSGRYLPKAGHGRLRVQEIAVTRPASKVIDLGCGDGRSRDLFRHILPDAEWRGVDIDDSPEVRRRRRLDDCFDSFNGIELPYETNSADLVFCKQVLHHVRHPDRSEEHTYELQSLMRISYAVFCLKK